MFKRLMFLLVLLSLVLAACNNSQENLPDSLVDWHGYLSNNEVQISLEENICQYIDIDGLGSYFLLLLSPEEDHEQGGFPEDRLCEENWSWGSIYRYRETEGAGVLTDEPYIVNYRSTSFSEAEGTMSLRFSYWRTD